VELNKEIKNKIVLIESADPGFDWIFTCGIKGLVTAYGGANSHMAIRANELHIPAAIGVGEAFFKEIMKKKILTLDCLKRQIFVNE
jgi:phosphoenolpyruvate-protein kinase (PTS system EI component)